jgi:hypothetical protein
LNRELTLNANPRIIATMPTPRGTSNISAKSKEFDELLLNATDDAFFSIGESVKQSIYFHLEERFKLKRKQIPTNLKKFQTALEKIFGSGARFIEILIMKNLYLKVGVSSSVGDNCDIEFIAYVNEIKQSYLKDKL